MKEQKKERSDALFFVVALLSVMAGALAYTYLSGERAATAPQHATPSASGHEVESDTGFDNHLLSKGIER